MKAADPSLGIAAFLKAQTNVNELTGGRVLRPELPLARDAEMPLPLVLVRPSGGGHMFGRGNLPVVDSRLDVLSYGSSRLEAENLSRETAAALKQMKGGTWEKVKLYWARISGMPASAIDPQTNWAYALVVIQVMHSLYQLE